jgi:hypothetical protein
MASKITMKGLDMRVSRIEADLTAISRGLAAIQDAFMQFSQETREQIFAMQEQTRAYMENTEALRHLSNRIEEWYRVADIVIRGITKIWRIIKWTAVAITTVGPAYFIVIKLMEV